MAKTPNSNYNDRSSSVFVHGINDGVTEEILWELFLQAGPLKNVRIPKDKDSGKQRPFAFVEYEHDVSVPYACELLDGLKLFQRPIKCKPQTQDSRNATPNRSPNTPFSPPDQRPNRSFSGPDRSPNRSYSGPDRSPNRSYSGSDQTPNRSFSGPDQSPNRSYSGPDQSPNRSYSGPDQNPNRSYPMSDQTPNRSFPDQTPNRSLPLPDQISLNLNRAAYSAPNRSPNRYSDDERNFNNGSSSVPFNTRNPNYDSGNSQSGRRNDKNYPSYRSPQGTPLSHHGNFQNQPRFQRSQSALLPEPDTLLSQTLTNELIKDNTNRERGNTNRKRGYHPYNPDRGSMQQGKPGPRRHNSNRF